jgi:hypothetical protein
MSTAADLEIGTTPAASGRFESHLLRLVGEPFLFLRRSYGDELVFHFGERVLGPIRKSKHGEFRYEHGTYGLHLRGSAWVVKGGRIPDVFGGGRVADLKSILGEPMQPADVVAHAPVTPDARVTGVTPFPVGDPAAAIALRVDLSDGSALVVLPTTEEAIEPEPEGTTLYELADWELITPHGTLQVGPGMKWHLAPPPSITSRDSQTKPTD